MFSATVTESFWTVSGWPRTFIRFLVTVFGGFPGNLDLPMFTLFNDQPQPHNEILFPFYVILPSRGASTEHQRIFNTHETCSLRRSSVTFGRIRQWPRNTRVLSNQNLLILRWNMPCLMFSVNCQIVNGETTRKNENFLEFTISFDINQSFSLNLIIVQRLRDCC